MNNEHESWWLLQTSGLRYTGWNDGPAPKCAGFLFQYCIRPLSSSTWRLTEGSERGPTQHTHDNTYSTGCYTHLQQGEHRPWNRSSFAKVSKHNFCLGNKKSTTVDIDDKASLYLKLINLKEFYYQKITRRQKHSVSVASLDSFCLRPLVLYPVPKAEVIQAKTTTTKKAL